MDWTSIYAEDGNEDLIIPQLLEKKPTTSRLSRLASRVFHEYEDQLEELDEGEVSEGHRLIELAASHHHIGYSCGNREVYLISINYILGVGLLGIPFAFARAGFILSGSILLLVTLFSYMTVLWVAETGTRFEKQQIDHLSQVSPAENSPLMTSSASEVGSRYEVIDLIDFYLGRFQRYTYQASLMALMYIGLLAYSQVFCGAVSAVFWANREMSLTGGPQLLFGMLVIPLSVMELEEQVSIQAAMAVARFVAIFVIVFGSLCALLLDDTFSNRSNPPFLAPADTDHGTMSYTACFSGFGVAFSASLFSQLFQHSVPGLLRPLRQQPAKLQAVPRTIAASLLTTSGLYFLLGITSASYFGGNTRSSINLNFSNFHFGLDRENSSDLMLVLCRFASGIVVVFPALDTVSVFPLIANTLGNNLYSASGGESIKKVARGLVKLRSLRGGCSSHTYNALSTDERKEALHEASRVLLTFWRLFSAIPPLFASLFATDLSFSLLLAGVAGVHVAFFAPSLLQLQSRRSLHERNVYSGWYSSSMCCLTLLVFATFSLGVVFLQIRDAIVDGT